MNANQNVAIVATLISEPSRAAILTALLDGRYHPASDLAYMAGIKPQTASFHLKKMINANVINVEQHGRHRYYAIRNHEVASVLESFLLITPQIEIKSLKQASQDKAIRHARTCYDHLAGQLGVQITSSLLDNGLLYDQNNEFTVTQKGQEFFTTLKIDLEKAQKKRRSYSHKCLDWSERRHHLAGALGNAILERLLELNWIERLPKTRAIKITTLGKEEIEKTFFIKL
jgi:DNA-binding transcriptional ArsR family regulator